MQGLVWALADHLGVVARAPGELLDVLATDRRRTVIVVPDLRSGPAAELVRSLARLPHLRLIVEVGTGSPAHDVLSDQGGAELNLDLEQWRDQKRYEAWQAVQPASHDARSASSQVSTSVELSDPAAICAADPWLVTASYEADAGHDYGGLRAAWLRAGQSLCREQSPASRALVLLAVLGEGADPRLGPALAALAEDTPWRLEWARVKGDVTPPWPGPVTALAVGSGPFDGCVLAVDHLGTLRILNSKDASAQGRLTPVTVNAVGVSVLSDGTLLILDGAGRVHADRTRAVGPVRSGIETLLNDEPDETQNLVEALREHVGTALAATAGSSAGVVALGEASGTVRVFGDVTGTAALHEGQVTALAALDVPLDDGTTVPMLYSGGADGTVRAWAPDQDPMSAPIVERTCPVVALHAVWSTEGAVLGVAWADGLVELHRFDTGQHLGFHAGAPVRALAATSDDSLVIAMDEALIRLTVRAQHPTSQSID
ncbi:hypothetical protein [Streptomyces sp. NPDC051219]|uniref:WD40 repeat domain-containing protein n=1 Tax=Streptomyces sp. NPDC051219 TaxID=3155283 RepID=UPI003419D416